MHTKFTIAAMFTLLTTPVIADLDLLTNNLSSEDKTAIIGLEYSYFTPSLDVFDFADKVQSSAKSATTQSTQLDILV